MRRLLSVLGLVLLFLATPSFAEDRSQDAGGDLAGVCTLKAVAFANPVFNLIAQAQAKCNELVARTGGDPATCKVVRLNNGKFRAQFRKLLQVNNQVLNVLLQGLTNFILQAKLFVDQQIALQAVVNNGCGLTTEEERAFHIMPFSDDSSGTISASDSTYTPADPPY